jgi:hypothetical protein
MEEFKREAVKRMRSHVEEESWLRHEKDMASFVGAASVVSLVMAFVFGFVFGVITGDGYHKHLEAKAKSLVESREVQQ